MDFIPSDYIAIRTAVDHILRTTHGDDWGRQELEIEKDETIIPGAIDDTGQPVNSPLKKALLTGFHSTAKHNATKAVSPSSETMRTI